MIGCEKFAFLFWNVCAAEFNLKQLIESLNHHLHEVDFSDAFVQSVVDQSWCVKKSTWSVAFPSLKLQLV